MDCYYSGDHLYYTLSALALLTFSLSTNVYYVCCRRRRDQQSSSEEQPIKITYTSSSAQTPLRSHVNSSLPDWAREEFLQQRNMN